MRGMRAKTSSNKSSSSKNGKANGGIRRKPRGQAEEVGVSQFHKEPSRVLHITCFIPTPSPNQWTFKSWREYHRIKSGWLKRIHTAAIRHTGAGLFGPPLQTCSLEIERLGIRLLDEDNLTGGLKPIIDGLVKLGFMADDTPDVIIQTRYHQTRVKTKREQQTRITIRETDGQHRELKGSPVQA
jgi:hypothetical protein